MIFSLSDRDHDSEWDHFLGISPDSHFEQTSGWGAVRVRYGWEVFRITAQENSRLIGGVQVLTRSIHRIGTIGYISRGPVASGNIDLQKQLVEAVERIAKKQRWLYCVFDYPYFAHELASWMKSRGYFAHPPGIPPSGLLAVTALLDLRPTEDQILARMTTNARRDIRRAQRSGLTFSEGSESDLPRFRELMLATCHRRNVAPTPPQKDYFIQLWRELHHSGVARLFLVQFGDEIVSAAFAFTLSETIRVWKVGWSGTHGSKEPNRWMWWEIIRWGRVRHFKQLDFVWIDTEDAKRAASETVSSGDFRDGTTFFKLSFGGQLHFPPTVQSKFFHPVPRLAHAFGASRFLKSPMFRNFVSHYWAKTSNQ